MEDLNEEGCGTGGGMAVKVAISQDKGLVACRDCTYEAVQRSEGVEDEKPHTTAPGNFNPRISCLVTVRSPSRTVVCQTASHLPSRVTLTVLPASTPPSSTATPTPTTPPTKTFPSPSVITFSSSEKEKTTRRPSPGCRVARSRGNLVDGLGEYGAI